MECDAEKATVARATTSLRGDITTQMGVSFPLLLIRRGMGRGRSGGGAGSYGAQQKMWGRSGRLEAPGSGWSVVLPARWVLPLWTALAFTGEAPGRQSYIQKG